MSGQAKKEIGLAAIAIAYSAATLWVMALGISGLSSALLLAVVFMMAVSWIAFIAFAFALLGTTTATVVLFAVPIILIAVGGLQAGALTAAVPLLALLALARWRIRDEADAGIAYRPARLFYGGVRWLALGLLLAAAGLAVEPVRSALRTYTISVPQAAIAAALRPIEPLLAGTIPGPAAVPVPLLTDIINHYLTAVVNNSPLLSALAALVALLLVSRLLVSLIAWPVLALIIILVLIAQQMGFARVVTRQVASSRLQLTEDDHG